MIDASHVQEKEDREEGPVVLRIFSYLPNPRVWKSLFVARLTGARIEMTGDKPGELSNWLWDVEPRLLTDADRTEMSGSQSRRGFSSTLYKTDAFLAAHPFGTVPAAFSPDGMGIFESNSILRATARAAPDIGLYGNDVYSVSRIDSFLDANLVFAREAQVYLLALQSKAADVSHHERMAAAYEFFLHGIESALARTPFLTGERLSIADISFACDVAQFLREGHYREYVEGQLDTHLVSENIRCEYPRAVQLMLDLAERDECAELKRYLRWWTED